MNRFMELLILLFCVANIIKEILMEPVKNIVIGTTLYLITYTILSTFEQIPEQLIIGMFSLSPFIVIYMVWRVLTAGEPSNLTFEDSFYEDYSKHDS
jgi:hypothetical protein